MGKKDLIKEKIKKRKRRQVRVRARGNGTTRKPRFSIFRSNYHIWCQLINDEKGETILAASDKELKLKAKTKKTKTKIAYEIGKLMADKAREKGVKEVFFDRNGYKYHGRVKKIAETLREKEIKF